MPIDRQQLDTELLDFDTRQSRERTEFLSQQINEAKRTRTDSNGKREFDLAELLNDASKAQAGKWRYANGSDTPTGFIPKVAAVGSVVGLTAPLLPDVLSELEASTGYSLRAAPGAQTLSLSATIARLSRVAQAGVNLIAKPIEAKAIPVEATDAVAMHWRPVSFGTVEAAPFTAILDTGAGAVSISPDLTDQPLTPIALPISISQIDFSLSDAPNLGVQISIPRSLQTSYGRERVAAAAMASIVLGLTRAVDKAFLGALASVTPALSPFSLANAASQGLRFNELRALIGATGTGATIDALGKLRCDGILAELTGDASASYIGSFERAAVVIHEDIPLHVERRNTQGDMTLTCYCTLQALVPDQSKFWVAA
jgi:hypothetical protein